MFEVTKTNKLGKKAYLIILRNRDTNNWRYNWNTSFKAVTGHDPERISDVKQEIVTISEKQNSIILIFSSKVSGHKHLREIRFRRHRWVKVRTSDLISPSSHVWTLPRRPASVTRINFAPVLKQIAAPSSPSWTHTRRKLAQEVYFE